MRKFILAVAFIGLGGGTCVVCLGAGHHDSSSAVAVTTSNPGNAPVPVAAVPELPWLEQVHANCSAYKAAPNDIKRSAVFRSNQSLLGKLSVKAAYGKLVTLATDQGGSALRLVVKADGGVRFATESIFAPIRRGSKVYKQAEDLAEGQCVIFSAQGLQASSITEQAQVCDTEYFARFTDIKRCRQ